MNRIALPPTVAAALVFVLWLPAVAGAADDLRNGNWWRGLNDASKVEYAIGLMDGALGFHKALTRPFKPEAITTPEADPSEDVRVHQLVVALLLNGVTAGLLRDALDQFYSDASNRLISSVDTADVVLNEIAGAPKSQIEQIVVALRQVARRN